MRHGPSASTRVGQLLSGPARASASSGSVAQRQPAAGEAAQGPAAIKQEQGAEPPAGPQLPQWPQRKAARPAKLGRAADAAGPAAAPVLGAAPGERVASGSGKRGPGGTAAAAAAAAAAGAAPRAGKERSPKGGGQAVLASFWEPGAVAGVAYEGGGPLDKRRPPWAVFLSRPLVGARRPRPAQRSLKEMGRFFLKTEAQLAYDICLCWQKAVGEVAEGTELRGSAQQLYQQGELREELELLQAEDLIKALPKLVEEYSEGPKTRRAGTKRKRGGGGGGGGGGGDDEAGPLRRRRGLRSGDRAAEDCVEAGEGAAPGAEQAEGGSGEGQHAQQQQAQPAQQAQQPDERQQQECKRRRRRQVQRAQEGACQAAGSGQQLAVSSEQQQAVGAEGAPLQAVEPATPAVAADKAAAAATPAAAHPASPAAATAAPGAAAVPLPAPPVPQPGGAEGEGQPAHIKEAMLSELKPILKAWGLSYTQRSAFDSAFMDSKDPIIWHLYYNSIMEAHEERDGEGVRRWAQRLAEGK